MNFFHPKLPTKGRRSILTKVSVPASWDLWHSENHWSNEERYIEKITVLFLDAKRAGLHLEKSHPALAIYDRFQGQTTPRFSSLLKEHNIISAQVPAQCTEKLQPIDVSVNKPVKYQLRKSFQAWYTLVNMMPLDAAIHFKCLHNELSCENCQRSTILY